MLTKKDISGDLIWFSVMSIRPHVKETLLSKKNDVSVRLYMFLSPRPPTPFAVYALHVLNSLNALYALYGMYAIYALYAL